MPKIRILVVDDAVVFRRLVSDELNADPDLEVVGTAANGRIALQKMTQVNPDLVILDLEMPEMDGLQFLKEVRKTYTKLPIILFSSHTERGAASTLEALSLGATDYFTKPTSMKGLDASLEVLRKQLVPEIKALCKPKAPPAGVAPSPAVTPSVHAGLHSGKGDIKVVALGASTGGPNALVDVLTALPANFPVPIVLVQHMPPMFTRLLAERLSAQGRIKIEEGRSGATLTPGQGWIAPGDHHMIVIRDGTSVRLLLHQDPPENSCRPAVDPLFRSVAQVYGAGVLGVVLTGMGQDGLRGSEAIRAAGGQIIAQDEATSVVWGMPGFVARAGLADKVLPLSLIASEILRRVKVL
jgi:two-component system chemotaxis response regulator CheB